MYKMKTCSKFKKCFKVLGGGGLKRKRVGGNHFLLKNGQNINFMLAVRYANFR